MKAFHASVALHLISILLAISSANGASPLDTWVNYPRPMGMTTLNGVAFGNGLFVAVGNNGGIATSADGIEWTRQEAGTTYPLNGVKFVNGHFFALSGEYRMIPGPSLISTDGTNWTQGPNLSDVTYGNGFYVGLPDTRSATLEEWTTPERTRDLNIEFGNGVFLASGSESRYSPDGQTWTAGEKLSLNPDDRLAFANGLFLASGLVELPGGNPGDYRRTILYSTDGVNWEKSRPGSPSPLSRAAAGGGYYVTGASSGDENFTIYYTTNLANSWTSVPVTIEG